MQAANNLLLVFGERAEAASISPRFESLIGE
jgi:hypothetical protein